jgi:hypothetical protein
MVPTWSPPGFKNFFETVQGSAHAVMYDSKVFLQYLREKLFYCKITPTLMVWSHITPILQI